MVNTVPGTSSAFPPTASRHTSNAMGDPMNRFVQGPSTFEMTPTKSASTKRGGQRAKGVDEDTVLKSVSFPVDQVSGNGPDGPSPAGICRPHIQPGRRG